MLLIIPAALCKHPRCPGGQDILGEISSLMTKACIPGFSDLDIRALLVPARQDLH